MRLVLITGGNGDIAKAIVKKLLEDSDYKILSPSKEELDVTSIESVDNYFLNKKIDVLINNAGYIQPQSIKKSDQKLDKKSIEVNIFGTFNCTSAVLKHNPEAKIINIGSSAATKVHGAWSAYCASKAAVVMATKCWAEDGVDVVCISPGRTATKMRTSLFQNEDPNTLLKAEDFATVVMYAICGKYNPGVHINVTRENVEELINESK